MKNLAKAKAANAQAARRKATFLLSELAAHGPATADHLFSCRFRRPRVDRFHDGLATIYDARDHAIPSGDAEAARALARLGASEVLRALGFPKAFLHSNHPVDAA